MRKLAILAFALPLFAYANNIETWNTFQMSYKTEDFAFFASEESRIGVDQTQTTKKLDEFHTTAGVNYKLFKHFSIGVQDDYALLRDRTDIRYRRDNRPGVNFAMTANVCSFSLMNRSRFVMRDLEGERPYFRYRNFSKALTPALCDFYFLKDIKLFMAYEWYFDEGSKDRQIRKNDKFGQFWTDFGICNKISQNISVEIFYRLIEVKSIISHDWSPGHAICTSISISF